MRSTPNTDSARILILPRLVPLLLMALAGGCLESSEASVAPGHRLDGTPSDDDVQTNVDEPDWPAAAELIAAPIAPIDSVLTTPPPEHVEGLLSGDLSCLGDNLPADVIAGAGQLAGRTVFFGTQTVLPGTTVTAWRSDGTELGETVSDDLGRFELSYDTVPGLGLGRVELWQPGFVSVDYLSSHPDLSWTRDGLSLGIIDPDDIDLIELAANVTVDDETQGTVLGRLFDCVGDGLAGATISIEGDPADVFYVTARLGLSDDLTVTTTSSQFYVFNLEPGTYTVAVWGLDRPGTDVPVLVNRAAVEVTAGRLTALDIYPE